MGECQNPNASEYILVQGSGIHGDFYGDAICQRDPAGPALVHNLHRWTSPKAPRRPVELVVHGPPHIAVRPRNCPVAGGIKTDSALGETGRWFPSMTGHMRLALLGAPLVSRLPFYRRLATCAHDRHCCIRSNDTAPRNKSAFSLTAVFAAIILHYRGPPHAHRGPRS